MILLIIGFLIRIWASFCSVGWIFAPIWLKNFGTNMHFGLFLVWIDFWVLVRIEFESWMCLKCLDVWDWMEWALSFFGGILFWGCSFMK